MVEISGDRAGGIGSRLAERYEVREQIGSGGFASVYLATQLATGQDVAIKLMRLDRGRGAPEAAQQIERFQREMRLCAELHHPNIVPILDSGRTPDGGLFSVFAYVPGWNLAEVLASEGCLAPAEALHLMGQVADALSSAHAAGIVHRDLKPANVMISATGARRNALVLDFGLGTFTGPLLGPEDRRLTLRGEYLGTPVYSAPEQLRGESPSERSDLYAWGLMLLECLTGQAVMMGRTPQETIHRHLSREPVPIPEVLVRSELGRLLRRVTEKDVSRREITAAELLEMLQRQARSALPSAESLRPRPGPAPDETDPASAAPADLSAIFLVPLARNPNFSGRGRVLDAITHALEPTGPRPAVVALAGMGGVGKSHLALEYAYRHADRYRMVAWLRAESPETLAADYCAIGNPLGLPETPDEPERIQAVRSWLERNDGWLLIFDNAKGMAPLRTFLPRSHRGHVIVTSRDASWRGLASTLVVDVLDDAEAVSFLLSRTGDADPAAAAELSEELGGLPLALEEAGAYMEATGRSIASYLPHLRSHRRRLLFGTPGSRPPHGALHATWELSFEQVEREAPRASELLKLCAFLAPDDVPLHLFRTGAKALPEPLAADLRDEIAFDAVIAALRRYSLVKVSGDHLATHRLVQLAVREWLPEQERAHFATLALRLLEAAYPISTLTGALEPDSGRLLPHALAAIDHARPHAECNPIAARLLRRTGIYRSVRGNYDEASFDLRLALGLFEQAPEPESAQIDGVLWELGMVLYASGEPEWARVYLERVVDSAEREPGSGFRLAAALMTLSWVLRTLGDHAASLHTAQRSLEITQRSRQRDPVIDAMSLSNIARGLWFANRVGEAKQAADQAFATLSKRQLHPLATGTLYNLGQMLIELGQPRRALRSAEQGIEVSESAYGPHHPLVSLNYGVKGAALLRLGALEPARACLERAIRGGQLACRKLHEDTSMSRSELGTLLARLGEPGLARETLEDALANADGVCGDPSRSRIHAHLALAELLGGSGELERARELGDGGLRLCDALYGPSHPASLRALRVVAGIQRIGGDREGARARLEAAAELAESAGLGDHLEYAEILEELAALCDRGGDVAGARARRAAALAVFEACIGPEHPGSRRARERLGAAGAVAARDLDG